MSKNISSFRIDYHKNTLDDGDYSDNPFELFNQWLEECINANENYSINKNYH